MSRKFFALFLFSSFVSLLFVSSAFAVSLREELLFSVVQIVSVSEDGDAFLGSGSTIRSDGLILTNYHVTHDENTDQPYSDISICYSVSQFQAPKCAATGKVLAGNKAFDLALVLPDKKIGKDGKPTKTSFQKYWKQTGKEFYTVPFKNPGKQPLPNVLDRITAWGYPVIGGSTITVTSGFVSGFGSLEDEKDALVQFIKTDTEISPGNSGGAAFNNQYAFIGVPTRAAPGQLGFIIPVQTIAEWFRELEKDGILQLDSLQSIQTYLSGYKDLISDDRFHDVALLLRHLKIMKGYQDDTFRPHQFLTRAEAVKMILAASGIIDPPEVENCRGVLESAWYRQPVCYARSLGWISSEWNVEKNITRGEFGDLLEKAFGIYEDTTSAGEFLTRGSAAKKLFEMLIQ